MADEVQSTGNPEKHLQTILLIVATGVLGWIGLTVTAVNSGQAAQAEQISQLKNDVSELKAEIRSGVDARDLMIRDMRIDRLENKVLKLEQERDK